MADQTAVNQNLDEYPLRGGIREQLNKLIADVRYGVTHRLTDIATIAMATTKSKVKTTTTAKFSSNGVVVTKAATDNFWTLTGAAMAVSVFRKYLLCINASGTASVIASSDAAAAADCMFTALPATGVCVVGVLTVATDATNPFTPATTLLDAAGITATYTDSGMPSDVLQAAVVRA